MQNSSSAERVELLGVHVESWTIPTLSAFIANLIERGDRGVIANHNLHSVYLYHHDSQMRELYSLASAVHVDGMALVAIGKLLGLPLRRENRITYVDWIRPLLGDAVRLGWRIFYLGSAPGVAERAAEVLRAEYPGLQIQTAHGYFDADRESGENRAVLKEISDFRPHCLLVGMGMPRQERWVLENFDSIEANAVLMAGACMDYVAQVVPTPPRWMGKVGLEWLFRLWNEPRRLWRRYLVEPWHVAPLIVRDLIRR